MSTRESIGSKCITRGIQSSKPCPPSNRNRRKMKKSRKESYRKYIRLVLKDENPCVSISCQAVTVMNNFVQDIFTRIASMASMLLRIDKKRTMNRGHIRTAVVLLLSKDLAKQAIAQGAKAILKYNRSDPPVQC